MLANWRKRALKSGSGTFAAKFLHSAAMRMHASVCFRTLSDLDIALLRKGGSACISQSSAGQKTLPVMKLRWRRAGHLARAILPFVEHIHGITICQNRTVCHGVFAVVVAADFVLVSIDGEYQGPQFAKPPRCCPLSRERCRIDACVRQVCEPSAQVRIGIATG